MNRLIHTRVQVTPRIQGVWVQSVAGHHYWRTETDRLTQCAVNQVTARLRLCPCTNSVNSPAVNLRQSISCRKHAKSKAVQVMLGMQREAGDGMMLPHHRLAQGAEVM